MTISSILAVILGAFKFFDQVKWFIERMEATPTEKRQEVIASVDAAIKKANEIGKDGRRTDDTSGLEDIINHG